MTETEPRAQLGEDEVAVLTHAAAGLTWQEAGVALAVSERMVQRSRAQQQPRDLGEQVPAQPPGRDVR